MEEQFVPYEQALELKELGFDEKCLCYYVVENKRFTEVYMVNHTSKITEPNSDGSLFAVKAPLWQQAFDWFRTKHGLVGNVEYLLNRWFCYIINDGKDEKTSRGLFTEFKTYEEAQLELLKRLVKTVKEHETRN